MVNGCGKVTGFALDPPGLGCVVTIGAEALGTQGFRGFDLKPVGTVQ
jgi:hypothetical protein